jgi:glycerol-3-phosphate dehydrogenase
VTLSTLDRPTVLSRLTREVFDLVVIGGGISGAGIAREAALRGASVALLEARDYASGTSSRSSKLIHGGLRYLALGDVALVRTTALERKVIRRLAPHLCEPRWMVVPARSRASLLKFRAGLTTYEKLGAVEKADLHRSWSGDELAQEEPLLDRDRFPYACAYREYLTDDAHLVLANLRQAVQHGAAVLNHAPVTAIRTQSGRACGVDATCRESGAELHVRGRGVINAAGPWVECVQRLEDPAAKPLLHLSKGVHVAFPAERLPVRHMLVLGTEDKRSIFAIRVGETVYLGTTDTSYPHGEDVWPEIRLSDVEYLTRPVERHLRCTAPRPDEAVAAWAGLRPLVAQPGRPPTEMSRRDEIRVGPHGLVTLAGGKLTGYRPTAQETLARSAALTGISLAPPLDEEPPLPGGDFDGDLDALAAAAQREFGLDADTAARLVRLYGSETRTLAASGGGPLVPGAPVLASEVEYAVRALGAVHVEDVVYRRIRTALYVPSARESGVEPVAEIMAGLLGWDDARRRAEIDETRGRLAADLGFRVSRPDRGAPEREDGA